jgi:hypothetical protein
MARYYDRMNPMIVRPLAASLLAAILSLGAGCGKQTRGNADAEANRAKTPAEGGATSTAGDAGSAKNFGDTQQKKSFDEASPSGKTITGGGSTGGPGARDKKEVTTQPPK